MTILFFIALVVISYLFGSISTAIIVCKVLGLPDPRTEGSNNPGATNVLRIGGKKAAFITLLGDMLKGTIPILITYLCINVFPESLSGDVKKYLLACVGFAAFIGHLYPIFFKFQGGKGVATALGVMLGWHYLLFVLLGITWLVSAFVTRYSSLSALLAFFLAPFYILFFFSSPKMGGMGWETILASFILSALLFWRHQSNIAKLIAGTEKKIGEKNSASEK